MKFDSVLVLLASATAANAASYYVEVNYDFPGNDIGSMPGTGIDNCYNQCLAIAQCKAVTFTWYNKGTCWFKTKRGTPQWNTGANSTVVYDVDPTPKVCNTLQNTDFEGNDIANKKGAATDCCDLCKAYPGCRAFSWNNYQGGTCWLKSKRGPVVAKADVQSADVFPNPDPQHLLSYGVDFVDHDIGNKPSKTAEGCFDICSAYPGCHAFAWNNYQGGTCWLKSGVKDTIVKDGVISAVVSASVSECTYEAPDNDYSDHDLSSVSYIPNSKDCCAICKSTAKCAAFAWNNYQGGTCWLKTASSTPQPKFGVVAGHI